MFDNNKKLCKSLGIKVLPFMELIMGEHGKVDGFTCGPSKISLLMSKLEDNASKYCFASQIECTEIDYELE